MGVTNLSNQKIKVMKTFIMGAKWVIGTIALIAIFATTGQSQNASQLKLNDAQIASAAVHPSYFLPHILPCRLVKCGLSHPR